MTFDLDLKKLDERRKELEAELAKINSFFEMVKAFTTSDLKAAMPVQMQNQQQPIQITTKRRGFTPGLRKAVTLALYTGPATCQEVARALSWRIQDAKIVIGGMIHDKICFLSETGHYQLTTEGKAQAAWFQRNPEFRTYSPKFGK